MGEVKDQVAGRNLAGRPQSETADLHIFGIEEQSFSWLWVLIYWGKKGKLSAIESNILERKGQGCVLNIETSLSLL